MALKRRPSRWGFTLEIILQFHCGEKGTVFPRSEFYRRHTQVPYPYCTPFVSVAFYARFFAPTAAKSCLGVISAKGDGEKRAADIRLEFALASSMINRERRELAAYEFAFVPFANERVINGTRALLSRSCALVAQTRASTLITLKCVLHG